MECKDTAELVCLYGTLLPQFVPKRCVMLLPDYISTATDDCMECLYDLGEYPGAVCDTTTDMRVDAPHLNCLRILRYWGALDCYEGSEPTPHATNLFGRKLQRVDLTAGDTIECWPTNTMGTLKARWSLPADAMNAQVSAHKKGANPSTGLGQAPGRTRGITS